MKKHAAAKSSFTLPPEEHARVLRLKRQLRARSNTEVIRRSLRLLEESLSRNALREAFRQAAAKVRESSTEAVKDLDHLSGEGLHRG
ncbi:MAG: type II toxin-antitoxin system ParD family antitoxin [Candidatus Binatia bacterium]